jgi:hypothetical protein
LMHLVKPNPVSYGIAKGRSGARGILLRLFIHRGHSWRGREAEDSKP